MMNRFYKIKLHNMKNLFLKIQFVIKIVSSIFFT